MNTSNVTKTFIMQKINHTYRMGTVKQIGIKKRTYYFYNDIIDLESLKSKLLKIDKKSYKDIRIYILDVLQLEKLVIVRIFTVSILCIYVLPMQTDILKK